MAPEKSIHGIPPFALAAYKAKPALVKSAEGGKINISLSSGEEVKVREKDIELVHPGPLKSLAGIEGESENESAQSAAQIAAREVWQLLLADGSGPVSLKELAELIFSEHTPQSAWAAFRILSAGLYFSGTIEEICCRDEGEVTRDEKKRAEKQKEAGERELFIKSLKKREKAALESHPDYSRFMQDVEALALGKSQKSRTMKDAGFGETPQDAHALLLDTGYWTPLNNPHPSRFGISLSRAKEPPLAAGREDRRDLSALAAFAIDNPWSRDPDDAVSLEVGPDGSFVLYVHVADPAAALEIDGPAEKEARYRGSTLYLAEGAFGMLSEEFISGFALGLADFSSALTFKITAGKDGQITNAEIFPSTVKVRRLSYESADKLVLAASADADAALLQSIEKAAKRNFARRTGNGAVNIELPETHISIENGRPVVREIPAYNSALWVKEFMLLAGEGACLWAASAGAAIPYVSQEAAELTEAAHPGMAGFYQLRRCMRPRVLSTKPARHFGLGLPVYTQVTSPLRRYTDLLAHLQIRACLCGVPPLEADALAARLAAGEAAAAAAAAAERASRLHWTLVFLSDKIDSAWEAVAVEKKGARWVFIIPEIAFETQVPLRKNIGLNEKATLVLKSVNIPKGEAVFIAAE